MLLRLYYLHSKSPKKSQELTAIAENLQEVFTIPNGGNAPVQCVGSRWISHKCKVLQRAVNRFAAYAAHLFALVGDSLITSTDRAWLQGYLQKWTQGMMLVGCVMYIDVLQVPLVLSQSLQEDGTDIVQDIKQVLMAASTLQSLAKKDPQLWPTTKLVLGRMSEEGDQKVYQGSTITHFSDSMLSQCSKQALADLQKLDDRIKERPAWSDVDLLRSILVFLDTCSWSTRRQVARTPSSEEEQEEEEQEDKSEIKRAAECIVYLFREPLEAKGVCLSSLDDEIEEVVDFYTECTLSSCNITRRRGTNSIRFLM